MHIEIENDGKERYQSFTAKVVSDQLNFEAYGSNENEAIENLNILILQLINQLKTLKIKKA